MLKTVLVRGASLEKSGKRRPNLRKKIPRGKGKV